MVTGKNGKTENRSKARIIIAIVIAVFAAAFILVLLLFRDESRSVETQFMENETSKSGYIEIFAKSFSAYPVKGELSLQLQFTPSGDIVTSDGLLNEDVSLYVNSAARKTIIRNPVDVTIDIRASTAMIFAIFIMVLEWLLAFFAIGTTVLWLKCRKIEVSIFGWMGALLFALVPLRNAMPAVPPIGVLSDVLAFFWVEILVALCLVTSVVTWFKRGSTVGNPR